MKPSNNKNFINVKVNVKKFCWNIMGWMLVQNCLWNLKFIQVNWMLVQNCLWNLKFIQVNITFEAKQGSSNCGISFFYCWSVLLINLAAKNWDKDEFPSTILWKCISHFFKRHPLKIICKVSYSFIPKHFWGWPS